MIEGDGYTFTNRNGATEVKEIRFDPGVPTDRASVLAARNHDTRFPASVVVWAGNTEQSWEQWISPHQPIYYTSRAEMAAVYRRQLGKTLP